MGINLYQGLSARLDGCPSFYDCCMDILRNVATAPLSVQAFRAILRVYQILFLATSAFFLAVLIGSIAMFAMWYHAFVTVPHMKGFSGPYEWSLHRRSPRNHDSLPR